MKLLSLAIVATVVCSTAMASDSKLNDRISAIRALARFFPEEAYIGWSRRGDSCIFRVIQNGADEGPYEANLRFKTGVTPAQSQFYLSRELDDNEYVIGDIDGHAIIRGGNPRTVRVTSILSYFSDEGEAAGDPENITLELTEDAVERNVKRTVALRSPNGVRTCTNLAVLRVPSPSTVSEIVKAARARTHADAKEARILDVLSADASLARLSRSAREGIAYTVLHPGDRELTSRTVRDIIEVAQQP